MKRYMITCFIILLCWLPSQAQWVVSDPGNLAQAAQTTAQVLQLTSITTQLKQVQEKVEKVKESVDWLKRTQAVIELILIMEATTCIIENLNININIASDLGVTDSCIDDFQYNLNIRRLLLSIDQINSVLTSGTKMDQAQRWQIISIVFDNFTKSQLNFSALNKQFETQIFQKRYAQAQKELETEAQEALVNRMVNRYK